MNSETKVQQLLEGGIDALENGDAASAQALLAHMLRLNPRNEWGWYYLSWTMNTAPGIVWCLDRVLVINPNQPHAKERLRRVSESAGLSIATGRTQPVRLAERSASPEMPGAVASAGATASLARMSEVGRLLDPQELRLRALEGLAPCVDAEPDGLRAQARSLHEELQDAQAATARLGSDTQLVIQAQEALARELDELLAQTAHAAAQLDSIERRSACVEVGPTRTEEVAGALVTRVGSLRREVKSPSAMFQAVWAGLGRLDGRFARTGRAVAGRERRSAARLQERACALRSRLRWTVVSILAFLFD
ncbi:MAG: hypothetical protein PVI63_03955 [Anaerolineae bacterium]|jgi:hypothetical protein